MTGQQIFYCAARFGRSQKSASTFKNIGTATIADHRFSAIDWNMRWPGTESNCRHGDFQSPALPTELPGQNLEPPANLTDWLDYFGICNQKTGQMLLRGYLTKAKIIKNRCRNLRNVWSTNSGYRSLAFQSNSDH